MICDENKLKRKDTKLKKAGNVSGEKTSKPLTRLKIMLEPIFLTKDFFLKTLFWQKIKKKSLFGYVQCILVVPYELKSKVVKFPPIFKKTEVAGNDIGDYMKNYAIENLMLKHPQRMLISSF